MADVYPRYGFEGHKGYASKSHMEAIRLNGPCPLHRKKFIRNIQQKNAKQLSLL